MTWYRQISPLQSKAADVGPDDNKRAKLTVNVLATKRPSVSFLEELIKILQDAGVATYNVNLFAGSQVVLPVGPGPYLHLRATGGMSGEATQNDGLLAYERPTAQLAAHALKYRDAEALIYAALAALAATVNTDVVP